MSSKYLIYGTEDSPNSMAILKAGLLRIHGVLIDDIIDIILNNLVDIFNREVFFDKFTVYTRHTNRELNYVHGILYSSIDNSVKIQYEKYSLSYNKIPENIKRILDCNFTPLKHYAIFEQYDCGDYKYYHWNNNYHSNDIHYGCVIEKQQKYDDETHPEHPYYYYGQKHVFYSVVRFDELTNPVGEYNIADVKSKLMCLHMSDSELDAQLKKGIKVLGLKQASYFGFWDR